MISVTLIVDAVRLNLGFRKGLLHKLYYYEIRGSTLRWINTCFSGQREVLDDQVSDTVPVLCGVPQ